MLAIRLQRTGRKSSPNYRMVVQDARRTPSSGKIVTSLGEYNPHTKSLNLDTEKATYYLTNGAQPSTRVAVLLEKEGVKLPFWVKKSTKKESVVKNVEKLRRTRPAQEVADDAPAEDSQESPVAEEVAEETVAESPSEPTAEEAKAEEA